MISSYCNVTQDRVRYLCSRDKRIYLSIDKKEAHWSIYIRSRNERSDEGPRVKSLQ